MRVIAGQVGGMRLKSPRGVHIRPMMDRVRGSLFNILDSRGGPGDRVLDLYAGTGAVGIEALSRGAKAADFVESHPLCFKTIRENLEKAHFGDRGRVFRLRVQRVLKYPELLALPSGDIPKYALVSVTPPYADADIVEVAQAITQTELLADNAVVVVEHPRTFDMPEQLGSLERFRERRYGATVLSLYSSAVRAIHIR